MQIDPPKYLRSQDQPATWGLGMESQERMHTAIS